MTQHEGAVSFEHMPEERLPTGYGRPGTENVGNEVLLSYRSATALDEFDRSPREKRIPVSVAARRRITP
jgi:hypothetical protein